MRMIGALRDLTVDRELLAVPGDCHALNESILSASADCIMIIAPDGRIELVNGPGIRAMELDREDEIRGLEWCALWPRKAQEEIRRAFAQAQGGEPARFTGFCPTAKGTPRWWDVVVTSMKHGPEERSSFLVIARDITTLRETSEQLQWSSEHDALTLLPNRRAFEIRLQASILEAMAADGFVGMLLVDLDHFKLVNDTLGHQAGDFLLRRIAENIVGSLKDGDFIARLGGDEFAIILSGVSSDREILQAGASVLECIQVPVVYEGRVLISRASIGGALYPRDAESAHELFKNADTALFALKSDGRGGTKIFHRHMLEQMQQAASQVCVARAAVTEDRIRPYYQPKVDLGQGLIIGFEALLRLYGRNHPPGAPATIAEAFKDYELASEIGRQMQHCVFGDVARWSADGLDFGRISINASPVEFLRDDYAERLLQALDRHRVCPFRVEVEVTEHLFVESGSDFVVRALHKLHEADIRISLDDFGTGYSSLSHLRDFPVDAIKIDRSFVSQIVEKREIAQIVRAVTNLAQVLDLGVIAEGIETPEQAAMLLAEGCTMGQGFLFGRPVPAEEVANLVGMRLPLP